MSFMSKISNALRNWMSGRNGTDELGIATIIAGLVISLLGSILGFLPLSLLGTVLYVITLFRLFSRNLDARRRENQKYLAITGNISLKFRQFITRMKRRKELKYFKCPQCKQLLNMKRGGGEKDIKCPKCGHQFRQKA